MSEAPREYYYRGVRECIAAWEAFTGVSFGAALSRTRGKRLDKLRLLLVAMLREKAGLSYPELGRLLQRDNSTMLYAVRHADATELAQLLNSMTACRRCVASDIGLESCINSSDSAHQCGSHGI